MGATWKCEGIETSMPHEPHEIQIIRTSETSETPMTAMCHDMMLMKFNLFLGHHDMTDDVEKTQRINATNLQLKMKDLRLQTVRMVQVWNRFEPPRKQACVFQICIVYHVLTSK